MKGRCPGVNESHSRAVQSPQRSIGLLVTSNLSAASWGPGDAEPLPGGADPPAVETVVEVDEDDPPCMDIYTSGAIRVADATFIFPMMYLHCNTGRSVAVGGRAFPVSAPIPCAPYRPYWSGSPAQPGGGGGEPGRWMPPGQSSGLVAGKWWPRNVRESGTARTFTNDQS